jgi:hypothetical protein
MGWATIWAILSQTILVTLLMWLSDFQDFAFDDILSEFILLPNILVSRIDRFDSGCKNVDILERHILSSELGMSVNN